MIEARGVDYSSNNYGYRPTAWVCGLFVALYAITTIAHLGQGISTKKWYMLCTVVLCGISELIGWSARLWSSQNPWILTPFLMQISTTIFAPTFTAAANFIILGTIINTVGPQFSRLPGPLYGFIFVTIDVAALIVQAVGGGQAAAAAGDPHSSATKAAANKGGNIMLGGIIVQLIEIVISFALSAEFFYNYSKNKVVREPKNLATSTSSSSESPASSSDNVTKKQPWYKRMIADKPRSHADAVGINGHGANHDEEKGNVGARAMGVGMSRNVFLMSVALGLSTLCLLIRSIYRTIELSNGWGGRIISTQVYFNVLDGAMVILAMYTLNFFHPGVLLRRDA